MEYDLKFEWITKKSKLPKEIGYEEQDEEETDYKKKLKDLFG